MSASVRNPLSVIKSFATPVILSAADQAKSSCVEDVCGNLSPPATVSLRRLGVLVMKLVLSNPGHPLRNGLVQILMCGIKLEEFNPPSFLSQCRQSRECDQSYLLVSYFIVS